MITPSTNPPQLEWGVIRASDGRLEVFNEAAARLWADRGNRLVQRVITTSEWQVVEQHTGGCE